MTLQARRALCRGTLSRVYLFRHVKKPDRYAGRFFALLMNGSHAPLTEIGRLRTGKFPRARRRWTLAAAEDGRSGSWLLRLRRSTGSIMQPEVSPPRAPTTSG